MHPLREVAGAQRPRLDQALAGCSRPDSTRPQRTDGERSCVLGERGQGRWARRGSHCKGAHPPRWCLGNRRANHTGPWSPADLRQRICGDRQEPACDAGGHSIMQTTEVKSGSAVRLWGLLALCGLLVVQGLVSFVVEPEPYPTVRMPGFGSVPKPNGSWAYTSLDVQVQYEDGSTTSPHVSELLEGMRFSSAKASASFLFGPESSGKADDETKTWLLDRAALLQSGETPVSIQFCWRKTTIDIADASVDTSVPCETTEVVF
ncbi:hypothetical protein IWX65_002956 [Arthrobacter sp. CAN_A214]